MVKNHLKINNRYEEYVDEKALYRDKRKKPKMPVKSAFLKQIPKIQQDRSGKHHRCTDPTNVTNNLLGK